MLPKVLFGLATLLCSVAAVPGKKGLRLIKTSEEDVGVWVSEAEKFERFVAPHVNFVDVTDTPVSVPPSLLPLCFC